MFSILGRFFQKQKLIENNYDKEIKYVENDDYCEIILNDDNKNLCDQYKNFNEFNKELDNNIIKTDKTDKTDKILDSIDKRIKVLDRFKNIKVKKPVKVYGHDKILIRSMCYNNKIKNNNRIRKLRNLFQPRLIY